MALLVWLGSVSAWLLRMTDEHATAEVVSHTYRHGRAPGCRKSADQLWRTLVLEECSGNPTRLLLSAAGCGYRPAEANHLLRQTYQQ